MGRAHWCLCEAIAHQRNLIEARVAYAESLRPPYELLDEATQTAITTNKWLCIQEEAEARSKDLWARSQLNNNPRCARYLADASGSFEKVALEAQKPNPNQQIIDRFTQAAGLHQQAVDSDLYKATCFHHAGLALGYAALEAQRGQRNQEAIDCYTDSARLYQEAAEALEALREKADYLNKAGLSFFRAAQEARQVSPDEAEIKRFLSDAKYWESKAAAGTQSCTIS